MNFFLDFLEKCSRWLDKTTKPMERRMSYFFCMTQIVICLMAMCVSVGLFIYYFQKQTVFEVRMVSAIVVLVILLILGPYTYMLITRDLKHIRGQKTGKKEDTAKKKKIEF